MKTKKLFPFLFCLLVLTSLTSILSVHASSQLNLTVATDQSTYTHYATVAISGSMSYGSLVPADGLVALQINDPTNNPTVLRTLRTGSSVPFGLPAIITTVYLSDQYGNPVSSVSTGSVPYFKVTVTNNWNQALFILIGVNVYDSNAMDIGVTYQPLTVLAQQSNYAIFGMASLPTNAHNGIANAFASIFSGWPKDGGVPYNIEQPFTFTITGGSSSPGQQLINSGSSGSYQFAFKLPKLTTNGQYSVTASTAYDNYTVTQKATTSFNVKLLGDFTGSQGQPDGTIDFNDVTYFVDNYIKYYTGQSWDHACDLTSDGKLDFNDVTAFVNDYIIYWSA